MKTLLIFTLSLSVLAACALNKNKQIGTYNSKNSVDWPGVYAGNTVLSSDEKMNVQLIIDTDSSYQLCASYSSKKEKLFRTSGEYSWDESGSFIALSSTNEGMSKFLKVGENKLWEVDQKGKSLGEKPMQLSKIDTNLFQFTWSLAQLDGERIKSAGKWPTIRFYPEGKVTGNGTCNDFTGTYILGGSDVILFGVIASTKKMCNENMDLENAYFSAMNKAVSYSLETDILYLKNAEGIVLAVFKGSK